MISIFDNVGGFLFQLMMIQNECRLYAKCTFAPKPFMRHYYSRNFIGTPNHAISGFANELYLSQNVTNVY